ncbi:ankyrin repeat-containing domain protein [Gongronella butleri]|nr:ankyrin repeat-containing domain protein [Gongronella butleri]
MARTSGIRQARQARQAAASSLPKRPARNAELKAPKSKRPEKVPAASSSTLTVKAIHDFKEVGGKVYYLCALEHGSGPVWFPENEIDAQRVAAFRETMNDKYGYDMDPSGSSSAAADGSASLRRSTRTSKLRAFLRVHDQINNVVALSDDEDTIGGDSSEEDDERPVKGKRKRASGGSSSSSSRSRKTRAVPIPSDPSKLRGKALMRYKEAQLDVRKKEREAWIETNGLADDADHASTGNNCCLRCSTKAYRDAVEANDMDTLKKLLEDKEKMPFWRSEDVGFFEDGLVQQALKHGNTEMAKVLIEDVQKSHGNHRTKVPEHILEYGSNTGYISRSTFGHAIRQVNESRGNRLGNAAFYRSPLTNDFNLDLNRNIYNQDAMHYFLALLHQPEMADNVRVFEESLDAVANGELYYHVVAAGNHRIAKSCMETFFRANLTNQLHVALFQDEELPSFRKPQVLKKTMQLRNLSPLLCAAIQPKSAHLERLFASLDAAERMETDDLARSVVHFAAASTTSDCLAYLIDQGFTLLTGDKFRLTPLVQAARYGRAHNIELIIKTLGDGTLPCTEYADHTLLRNKRRALHYAAFFGHADACKALIAAGASVDIYSSDKMTPLLLACQRGHLDVVKVLLDQGNASLLLGDRFDRSPLHLACMFGHLDLVDYLLRQGIDANAGDSSSNTPSHYAAAFGYLPILQRLLTLGQANPSANNVWRATPCSVANMKGHVAIVQYLLSRSGANLIVNFRNQQGLTMLHETVLEKVTSDADIAQNLRRTRLLLEHNANVNTKNMTGGTVLHALASCTYYNEHRIGGDLDDEKAISYQLELAQILLDAGADLTAECDQKYTPLLAAAAAENHTLVAFLIRHGANYWSTVTGTGASFFHYFLGAAGKMDNISPYDKLPVAKYQEHRQRHIDAFDGVMAAMEAHPVPKDQANIDHYNHDGYTALMGGVRYAIEEQRKFVAKQKALVKANSFSKKQGGLFNNDNGGDDDDVRRTVRFVFCFDQFLAFARRLFALYPPDASLYVKLPHAFFKDAKVAKKPADYPAYTGMGPLHAAAYTQNAALLAFLLELGAAPDQPVMTVDGDGATAMTLGYFLRENNKSQYLKDESELTLDLIHKRFDIQMPDFKRELYDSMAVYLEHGADPCLGGHKRNSALMKAAEVMDGRAIELMCQSVRANGGSDHVNHKNLQGFTALSLATKKYIRTAAQRPEETQKDPLTYSWQPIAALLSIGADINTTYVHGDNVLMLAFSMRSLKLIQLLLHSSQMPANHFQTSNERETPLLWALQSSPEVANCYVDKLVQDLQGVSEEQKRQLIDTLDKNGKSALAIAAALDNLHVVKALLALGAELNPQGTKWNPLVEAIKSNAVNTVEALLEAGASLTYCEQETQLQPLHFAIVAQKPQLVRLLLKHGANVNAGDKWHQTPLHWAIEKSKRQTNRSMKIEQLLLDAGANVNAQDALGRSPLHLVFTSMHLVPWTRATDKLLKAAHAAKAKRIEAAEFDEEMDTFVQKFGGANAAMDAWLKKHRTRMLKAEKAQKKAADAKKKKEARLVSNATGFMDVSDDDDDAADNNDDTIMMDEVMPDIEDVLSYNQFEQDNAITPSDPVDMLSELLSAKDIQLDLTDLFGRTPTHYAVVAGAVSCMNLLLDSNQVNLHAVDQDQNGILQLALRYNHSFAAIMVANRGAPTGTVYLPHDKQATVLNYSLSHSFMNVAYMFLNNCTHVLESLAESLAAGKFHFADRLTRNANDWVLAGTTEDTKQNLWHIISNFKPFDDEIWADYLEDYLALLTRLNVHMMPDATGAMPLHYAAKHGQHKLIKHFLTLDPSPALTYVADGNQSQMMVAVKNNDVDAVKLLLDAGLLVNHRVLNTEVPSMLYNAVDNKNTAMVKLLLDHGVPLDDDSAYGRASPLGLACIHMHVDIVKLLTAAGANANTPTLADLVDKDGKRHRFAMPPIIYVSHKKFTDALLKEKKLEIFKLLLKGGANPNVLEPEHPMLSGQSCLMYCVTRSMSNYVKALLDNGADLNMCDRGSSRSVFYQVIFKRKELKLTSKVYDLVTRHSKVPEINKVDEETGMVPLEYAIRHSDIALIDCLMSMDADVNVVSGAKVRETDLNDDQVNVLFHAMLQSDLEAFKMVVKASSHPIEWDAVDDHGRTLFARMADMGNGYSLKRLDFLEFCVTVLSKKEYKSIMDIADNDGLLPTQLALKNGRKDLYDAFCKHGAKKTSYRAAADTNGSTNADAMDIEPITMEAVIQDANAEIALLMDKKNKNKENSDNSQAMDVDKDDDKIEIDHYSGLQKTGVLVMDDELKRPFDIMLMRVDVSIYGYNSTSLFYKLSVIYDKLLEVYVLWTRWGELGQEGMHQKTPYLSEDEAVREFQAIFRAKSGNAWRDVDNFTNQPGKYQRVITRDPIKDMAILQDEDLAFGHHELLPSQLSPALHRTMTIFCDFNKLKVAHERVKLDIPIGQVPTATIQEAGRVLKEIETVVQGLQDLVPQRHTKEGRHQQKDLIHKGIQLTTKYYSLLPTTKGERGANLRTILNTNVLHQEMSRFNDITYIDFTLNVVLAAKHRAKEINPFDYSYRTLNNQLTEITQDSMDFRIINKYMTTTSRKDAGTFEIAHLFSIDRHEERDRFKPHENDRNRKLLWHGSELRNFMGILKQGLRSKPRSAQHSGSLFGNGVYFADMFHKSLMFTPNYEDQEHQPYAMLLLCEVALGDKVSECHNVYMRANTTEEYTSIKGAGKHGPDPVHAIYDDTGMEIPVGPCVDLPRPEGQSAYYDNRLSFSEYIVDDVSRVKMRYLVLVRNTMHCTMCKAQSTATDLKPLQKHKFPHVFDNSTLTSYEVLVADLYLDAIGKTRKQYVDDHADDFWANKQAYYPADLKNVKTDAYLETERESPMCTKCAMRVFGLILAHNVRKMLADPAARDEFPFLTQQRCRYGGECRGDESLAHCRKFHHWLPPTADANKKPTQPYLRELLLSADDAPTSDLYNAAQLQQHQHAASVTDEDLDLLLVAAEPEVSNANIAMNEETGQLLSVRPNGGRGLGRPGRARAARRNAPIAPPVLTTFQLN